MYVVEDGSLAVFVLLQREMTLRSPAHTDVHPELWCSVGLVHQTDLFPVLIFDSVDCPVCDPPRPNLPVMP